MTLGDFTDQAATYARSRPDYPIGLIEKLARMVQIPPGGNVADLGAGTGIFTSQLSRMGFSVWAVEPNQAMKDQGKNIPAHWISGTFENTGLESQTMDWVVAAQAFHWAEPKTALPEIRRILRPGRHFTILWNDRAKSSSEFIQWVEDRIVSLVPSFTESYRNQPWDQILESTGDFECLNMQSENHSINMHRERFLSLWKSHNRLSSLAGPEKLQRFLGELEERLNRQTTDFVPVPYVCNAWTARRKSP